MRLDKAIYRYLGGQSYLNTILGYDIDLAHDALGRLKELDLHKQITDIFPNQRADFSRGENVFVGDVSGMFSGELWIIKNGEVLAIITDEKKLKQIQPLFDEFNLSRFFPDESEDLKYIDKIMKKL